MDMREPEETVEVAPSTSRGRGRRALGLGVTLAVVVALLAGFGALALSKHSGNNPLTLAPQSVPGSTGSTAGWQLYHDPLNLFTLRLPPGWTAKNGDLGSYTEGNRDGSFSGQSEYITLSDPARGAGSTNLSVSASQIPNSPIALTMNCEWRTHESATFNGYPADTTLPAVILFESANAHFQIDETIPGVIVPINSGGALNPPPPPTAAPAATVTADKALIATMLTSFRPTDPHPLACH